MNSLQPARLTHAVAILCPEIAQRVQSHAPVVDETRLWWELCACLLSSQVSYTVATAAADAIIKDGCLAGALHSQALLGVHLTEILCGGFATQDGRISRHRFGQLRARQIAATHAAVLEEFGSLSNMVQMVPSPMDVRQWLVEFSPGFGPKQASMFLRNIGASYDLAVLDRHVLRYMNAVGLGSPSPHAIARLVPYHRHEIALRGHANDLGVAVGLLDWAIWIVMRAAQRLAQERIYQ